MKGNKYIHYLVVGGIEMQSYREEMCEVFVVVVGGKL